MAGGRRLPSPAIADSAAPTPQIRQQRSSPARVDSGEDVEAARGRGLPISAAPASPLEDDNLLLEILLRLPPRPSSLPRASFVCKRWRRLVSDPGFLRNFRRHHRKPPLLGFFYRKDDHTIEFTPTLDSPDRIPAAAGLFNLRLDGPRGWEIVGCRHGRVLILNTEQLHALVWDPITGDQLRLAFPDPFDVPFDEEDMIMKGAIVCAAGDQEGHVHGACHSSPFQVVLVGCTREEIFACVYSSETGTWGNLISVLSPPDTEFLCTDHPNVLVGNTVCWVLIGNHNMGILGFDLVRQSLDITEVPRDVADPDEVDNANCALVFTPSGGGGLIVISDYVARLWRRNTNSSDVDGWVVRNTTHLNTLLPPSAWISAVQPNVLGLAEEDDVMFLLTDSGALFLVDLETKQFKKLPGEDGYYWRHPFTSFYMPGT